MKPLVSVILPCYNAESHIEDALNSVLTQTYQNLEILCIDDGSTDNTRAILEEFSKRDKRIRLLFNKTNLKLINTLNIGVAECKGEYIARMDSDDICTHNRIEKQLNYLINNNIDICGTFVSFFYNNNIKKYRKRLHIPINNSSLYLYSLLDSPLIHPSILVKSNILKKFLYKNNPSNLHIEDYELFSRLFTENIKFGIIPEFLLFYRINPSGVSFSNKMSQSINHINQSIINIKNCTGLTLTENTVGVLTCQCIPKDIDISTLNRCLDDFKSIYLAFSNNNVLTKIESNEIRSMFLYKKFCIYAHSFFKSSRSSRVIVLFKAIIVLSNLMFGRIFLKRFFEVFCRNKLFKIYGNTI